MNAQLPPPGTVWRHKITRRLMRIGISGPSGIIAHNCEAAMRDPKITMVSWSGDPDTFHRAFVPASSESYPKLAS